jgi:L-iditol 2-dehydrogenase
VNIFAGLAGEGRSEIAANLIHYHELIIAGVTGSRRRDHKRAVWLIERGAVDVAPLVTHRFAVADARAAIETTAGNEGLKSAVVPATAA